MSPHSFSSRRSQLRERIVGMGLDGFLVSAIPSIRYLTGFTGSNAFFLLTEKASVFFTDPRYAIQAAEETDCSVRVARGPLVKPVGAVIGHKGLKKIGFESQRMLHSVYAALSATLSRGATLVPATGTVEELRAVKSADEIGLVRRAVELCSRAFGRTVQQARPGLHEFQLAALLDHEMRKLGAEGTAFDTIVASGPRSALAHAAPTSKRLTDGELVLIDVGARLNGYVSDMTRVLHLGKPPRRVRRVHAAVLEAQLAALDVVKDGVPAASVDRAARKVLRAHGMDSLFVHSTGHGLGLEIHEPPRLGKGEAAVLRTGMVVTIEPGVYVKGFAGVRIEDTIVVTETGCEILTPTTKELLVI